MNGLIKRIIESQQDGDSNGGADLLIMSLVLLELDNSTDASLGQKLAYSILKLKSNSWVFSDNLLINFVVLSALIKYNPKIIDGSALGKILRLLTDIESQEGGPYYSFVGKKNNIDLGVNCAIAYFLSLNKVELPELNNLIEKAISKNDFKTEYSDNKYLIYYLISKFYQGPLKKRLMEYTQFFKPAKDKDLEELMIRGIKQEFEAIKTSINDNTEDGQIIEKIFIEAENRFADLNPDFKKITLAQIQRTIKSNSDKQMSLIAYYFKKALVQAGQIFSDEFITKIGLANIFYWTAFIIYDDFWDEDEKATPSILPTANLYARHYINFYDTALPDNPEFIVYFHELMDKLDEANTWETLYCRTKVIGSKFIIPERLPNYEDYEYKFRPASGQILGPLLMLLKIGYKLDSPETKNLIEYFKNYLIAMQINDDAHDWVEDMERGHLSTVVVLMIHDWLKVYPDTKEIDLVADLEKLQQIFWYQTMPRACQKAIDFTKKSRTALDSMHYIENPQSLRRFIDITENTAQSALTEYQNSLKFLAEFDSK